MTRILLLLLIFFNDLTNVLGKQFERYKSLPDTSIISQNLGYKKNISITVPKEYQTSFNKNFPLIVIFDSQNPRSFNYLRNTIDYLTSNEQIPASIIIGVESSTNRRFKETDLPVSNKTSLGDKNESFIFEELIPFARKLYKASNFTLLIGHSRYGYFSTFLLTKRPADLNAVITISPFYTQKNIDLVDSLASLYKRKQLPHRIQYIFSAGADFPEDFKRMQSTTQKLNKGQNNIVSKGYSFPQADHNATPGLTGGIALYDIFSFWTEKQDEFLTSKNSNLKLKEVFDKEIADYYGTELRFSLGVLNGKGWQFYNEKKYLEAINAWSLMLEEYPNFSEGYLGILRAKKSLGITDQETIERFKHNLEQSDFYSVESKKELVKELEEIQK